MLKKELFEQQNLKPATYYKRKERGKTEEEALSARRPLYTKDGIDYYTKAEISRVFGIHINVINTKLKKGYTFEEIINGVTYRAVDHLGNKFRTTKEMCDFHHVNVETYRARRKRFGMSVEEALSPEYLPRRRKST